MMVGIDRRSIDRFYLADADIAALQYDSLAIVAPSALEEAQGWIVGTQVNTACWLKPDTVQLESAFVALPIADDAAFGALGYRATSKLSGNFASGDWVLSAKVKSGATYYAQRGDLALRLWRSVNADGSSGTQITSGWALTASPIIFSAADQYQVATVTVNPGAVSLVGEYIFVEIVWAAVASGGNAAAAVYWVHNEGAAEQLVVPTFTMLPSPLVAVTSCP